MMHGHDHHHHHDEEEADTGASPAARRLRIGLRFVLAGLIVVAAGFAASSVMVPAGQATVITRFGDLSRVLTQPGLAWKLPAPLEGVVPVDLRLRTTSTGLQDVGTKDGLRILVQAYAAWQVPDDPARIRQFLRAVRNDPDEAARQLRSLIGSALQVTASSFELADLVDTDPARQNLPGFEARLRDQVAAQALDVYGVRIAQVGIERLSLPDATLAATVSRMRAERETVAAARTAEGLRAAAELRSEAARDSRITLARSRTEAAGIEAASRQEAAAIQARAYQADPDLYALLRSMDTLGNVVGPNTRMILRTDAAPFNVLIQGPAGLPATPTDKTPSDKQAGLAR
jgi:membrane protease subunit HflC